MNLPEVQKGLGAELSVDANTKAFSRLFHAFNHSGINPVQPDDVHITVIDSSETLIPIRSERDQMALDDARTEVGLYLSSIGLNRLIFRPAEHDIEPYGHRRKKIGIKVDDDRDILKDIRANIGDILYEKARVIIPNRQYHPHIIIGEKSDNQKLYENQSSPFKKNQYSIPQRLHIDGFKLNERHIENHNERRHIPTSNHQRFRNQPKSFRNPNA